MKLTVEKAEGLFKSALDKIKDVKLREFLEIHVPLVKDTVLLLAKRENVDLELLTVAAWVHDIGYVVSEEGHAIYSLKLLESFDVNDKLKDCILNHGNSEQPKTTEGKIFQIADKISIFDSSILDFFLKNNDEDDFAYFKKLVENSLKFLGE